jgi:hypothetical protein
MKTLLRIVVWTLLSFSLLAALLLGLWCALGAPHHAVTMSIDGGDVTLPVLHGADWLLAVGLGLLALVIVMIVVPLALLLGFGIPALLAAGGLAIGLLSLGAVLTLLGSPLLLIGLLCWWLWRRSAQPPASTTIAG